MHAFRPEETMTKEEAEEVVRRFQETGSAGRPRVADVAEALGTSPEDVARILGEVRGQSPITVAQQKSPRRTRIALAAGVAAFLLATGAWTFAHRTAQSSDTTPAVDSPTTPAIAAEAAPTMDTVPVRASRAVDVAEKR